MCSYPYKARENRFFHAAQLAKEISFDEILVRLDYLKANGEESFFFL